MILNTYQCHNCNIKFPHDSNLFLIISIYFCSSFLLSVVTKMYNLLSELKIQTPSFCWKRTFCESPLNVCIPTMIIICLYHNHLTRVMNQFDLEFKKLFSVQWDFGLYLHLYTCIHVCVYIYTYIINIFSSHILLNTMEFLVEEIISGIMV